MPAKAKYPPINSVSVRGNMYGFSRGTWRTATFFEMRAPSIIDDASALALLPSCACGLFSKDTKGL